MERTKLLLIDGERTFAEAVIKTLGGAQLDVTWSGSAADGEQTARSWQPDVVVIDVNLPDSNGFKLFTRLHRQAELEGARFVITGEGVPEKTFQDHQKLKRHADLYIHKPFRPDELQARLQHELGIAKPQPKVKADVPPLRAEGLLADPADKPQIPGRDEDYLDELDNLLGDVDDAAFKPTLRDDDADLNELNRLLGGDEPTPDTELPPPPPITAAAPPFPVDQPEPVALDDDGVLEELDSLPLEDEDLLTSSAELAVADEEELEIEQDLPEDEDLSGLSLDEAAPEEDLDVLLEADESDLPVGEAPVEDDVEVAVALEESAPDNEPAFELEEDEQDSDPIAQVRESEVAALIDNLESARRERDLAHKEIDSLRAKLQTAAAPAATESASPESDKLKRALKKAQDVAQLKTHESAEMARRVDELEHTNGELAEELNRLRAKLKTQADDVAAQYKETLTRAKAKIDELTAALNDANVINSETQDAHKARIASLENELRNLNQEIEQITNERTELLDEMARQKQKAEELLQRERERAAELLEREKALWQQRLEDASVDSKEADERLENLHQRIAELESQMDASAQEFERQLEKREEEELANRRKLEHQHEQQIARLTEQLTQAREQGEQLEESREALKSELSALGDKVAEQRATITELKGRLKDAQSEIAEREGRMTSQSETLNRIEELEAEVELLRKTNARNEKRVIDAFTRLKADIEARARVEKALMLALKLIKSPATKGESSLAQDR